MSRRRNRNGEPVRGPTSALTSFLKGLGVEPSFNTRNEASAQGSEGGADGNAEAGPSDSSPNLSTPAAMDDDAMDVDDSDARPAKRTRRATSIDSDDLDADPSYGESGSASARSTASPSRGNPLILPQPLKAVGQFMDCGECSKKFTVTVYTREHPKHRNYWLCSKCPSKFGIDPFAKPKKATPAKKAPAKKARDKVVHYEVVKGAPALADICIRIIGKHIEDVEVLGDIGTMNLDKVCRIICKSRRLTPETAPLFYSADRETLSMYDCTNLGHDSYVTMASLCPNLHSLRLDYCGQMTTDTIIALSKSLRKLKTLELYGPFLVRKEGWIKFFETAGKRLEEVLITQSPRIDLETIQVMVRKCPNIRRLRLSEVGKMDADFLKALGKLKKLEWVEICNPGGQSLDSDAVATFLKGVGSKLSHLNLNDNPDLDDEVLKAIAKHCPNLTSLCLRDNDLSDEGLTEFFDTISSCQPPRPTFTHLDFEKGHDLSGPALRTIVKHSGSTLQSLSILGWRKVDKESVETLATCQKLEVLDLGWCRCVTDFTMKDLLDGCKAIKEIRVWGCNQLTDNVPRKHGVKVVGIESLSL